MKTRQLFSLSAIAMALFFTSCDDDDETLSGPTIEGFELGIGNSQIGYVGSDIHMEADIEAIGKIQTITVDIHKEEGEGWEHEQTYDEYEGMLNANFHKHIDIPADAATGEYHFHFIVTDMVGNQTELERELTLEKLEDDESPVITVSATPDDSKSYSNGDMITISGTLTDNVALAGTLVALVRVDDNISNADVKGSTPQVIVMLHTHDFSNPGEFAFEASIEVGATHDNNMTPAEITGENAWESGEHYILIKCKDANGNGAVSAQYPVSISL